MCEHSDTAVRRGIDNSLPEDLVENATLAAEGGELICDELGYVIVVHSWFRCEALERFLTENDFERWCKLHKKPVSAWPEYFARKAHPRAVALDFTCPHFGTPAEVAKMVSESEIKFDQLILEGTWVHASFDRALRRQILLATFKDGVPEYKQGLA